MKKIVYPFIVLIALTTIIACSSNDVKNNTYYQLANAIEQSIAEENWAVAEKQAQSFKIYHNQNYWRFETNVEKASVFKKMGKELNIVNAAIEKRDKEKMMAHIAIIKNYAKDILL